MSEKPAVNDYPCANDTWTSIPAAYTGHKGKHIFCYTDRKNFVFGHCITDDLLAGMEMPRT